MVAFIPFSISIRIGIGAVFNYMDSGERTKPPISINEIASRVNLVWRLATQYVHSAEIALDDQRFPIPELKRPRNLS